MPKTEKANEQARRESADKILNAARRVFAAKGSAGTMAEVAAEAGISQGLAYRYFPSKKAILAQLVRELIASPDELLVRVQRMPGSPGERLRSIVSRMMERREKMPEFYQIMGQAVADRALSRDLREATAKQGAAVWQILRQLIVEGQTAGEVAKDDPDQLLRVLMACLDGLSRGVAAQGSDSSRNFPDARIVMRIFDSGMEEKSP